MNVKVSREKDSKYKVAEEIITVTFTKKVLRGMKPVVPTVSSNIAEWGTEISVTTIAGQEYQMLHGNNGRSYAGGKINATQPCTDKVRTRVVAVPGKNSASAWSDYKQVTLTRQT